MLEPTDNTSPLIPSRVESPHAVPMVSRTGDMDIADLLRQARSGDFAAARRVHELARPFIVGISTALLRHREDAEDAAQDIIFKVIRGSEVPEDFWPWLRVLTRNHCLNMIRARVRRAAGLDGSSDQDDGGRFTARGTGIATRAHRRESREQMTRRIEALPVELMEVVLFHYGPAKLSRPEIAEMLGIAESAVRTRLEQAKSVLGAGAGGLDRA